MVRIFSNMTFFVQATRRSLMGRASVSELKVRGSNLPWQWNRLKFGEIPKNDRKFVYQIFDKKMFRISSFRYLLFNSLIYTSSTSKLRYKVQTCPVNHFFQFQRNSKEHYKNLPFKILTKRLLGITLTRHLIFSN